MTIAPQTEHTATSVGGSAPPPVTLTIDGVSITVPRGTLVIRAAEQLGIPIPRFCDHPLLDPVGACRQCIVAVEGQRKPLTACTTVVTEGMVVQTQHSSQVAAKAQSGTMELLLINHPLDCPMCDKGGECPLQNQAMSSGRAASRFHDVKRTYPKPVPISSEVLLDRERCVLCARCTRFSAQIAGDPFIELFERSAGEQVSVYRGEQLDSPDIISGSEPFNSYFSGNTIQICPVGALTSATYRFRSRPFDLVSTPSVCEHCSSGCAQRTDWRRNRVLRRLAGDDPEVNEEWNCDKGRFAFTYPTSQGRITTPLIRDESGQLVTASWSQALTIAAEGLREARDAAGVGVLTGGRLTVEDSYAYSVFARLALNTNDIDFRARPHSVEEADFLIMHVAGLTPATGGLRYRDLDTAPTVLLVGLEPEEESPIVFLRLRKASRRLDAPSTTVYSVAPWATRGLEKLSGTLVEAVPGTEACVLDALTDDDGTDGAGQISGTSPEGGQISALAAALRKPGSVVLLGERAASAPGALSAAARLARATGARLAWIPRRAGDRGAVEAGALPDLLPGARWVVDRAARAELEQLWGVAPGSIPATPGRSTTRILAAAANAELNALLIAGVDLDDLADPAAARNALRNVGFVVSLELRESSVTEYADVVLPVAASVEKAGTYYTWEGRARPFGRALPESDALPDSRVLDALAAELDVFLSLGSVEQVRAGYAAAVSGVTGPASSTGLRGTGLGGTELGGTEFSGTEFSGFQHRASAKPERGEAVLATWHHLLDAGTLQLGEPHLAGTAPRALARLCEATASEIGLTDGDALTVTTDAGSITLPLEITRMPQRVVWLPTNSPGSAVRRQLAADSGDIVKVSAGTTSPLPDDNLAQVAGGDAEGAGEGPQSHGGER
ncbi:MAG: NADH-quinone oxidoreductase subunit G [Acidimicrobiales bacterium]|nr:MAG: NADH-quinone oxidoreductase subunit G [Acidimicrobiales bacterium]